MFLNNIISWGMVAMLSSLTMTTGSVDRNSTLSQNNNPASVEEATEGCAANFVCPLGTEPFYYNSNNFQDTQVKNHSNWLPGYNPNSECGGEIKACVICVSSNFIIIDGDEMTLDEDLEIETIETESDVYKVNRLPNDSISAVSNRDN